MTLGFERSLFVGKLSTELRDVDLSILLYAGNITAFQSKAVSRMLLALLPALSVHFQNMFRFSVFGDLFDEAIKNGLTAIQVMLIRGCWFSRLKYHTCEERVWLVE